MDGPVYYQDNWYNAIALTSIRVIQTNCLRLIRLVASRHARRTFVAYGIPNRDQHFELPDPKSVLALDGGGPLACSL